MVVTSNFGSWNGHLFNMPSSISNYKPTTAAGEQTNTYYGDPVSIISTI